MPGLRPASRYSRGSVRKYGITLQQAGAGSPDLAWLRGGGPSSHEAHFNAAAEHLALGIEVFPGRARNDVVLWLEGQRAVIAGDTLADFGRGLDIPSEALTQERTREQIAQGLRPLLQLPVERVLPTHGMPNDRSALERVLG